MGSESNKRVVNGMNFPFYADKTQIALKSQCPNIYFFGSKENGHGTVKMATSLLTSSLTFYHTISIISDIRIFSLCAE